jgi:NADH dehydrogenase
MKRPKVIIIGAGFGGLAAAKSLKKADVDILLIDKTNHHLFQPLLYQVATAALSPGDIAAPVRGILRKQKNARIIMGEVVSIDKENQKVKMQNGEEFNFDYLIAATGSRHSYFGNDEWEKYAPGLKTISDALKIRERILLSFEKAERSDDSEEIAKHLTFVVVGGGPTGVEMAGAIAEIAKKSMLKDFRKIDPSKTKIILIEGTDKLLLSFDQPLNDYTKKTLEKMGVIVKVGKFVKNVNEDGVQVNDDELIPTHNIIWAAGNTASPILTHLKTELDKTGRVMVEKDCSIKGYKNIFVIGDAANFIDDNGKSLPGVAPVAEQQGKYVAEIISNGSSEMDRKNFKYFDKGNLATIGRAKAILQINDFKLSGFTAWLIWGFVHIAFLINFRKRYKVMTEWIWYYLTFKRDVRLITNKTIP